MATNLEVFEAFLLPMKRLFLRPPHASDVDESAALAEYADALSGFHKPVLEAAWKSIRDGQTGRYWPTVAVCIRAANACRAAFRETEREKNPGAPKPIAGRMVDGRWQPFDGCDCDRCQAMRRKYHADNSWWYEFVLRKYGRGIVSREAENAASRIALARAE